MRVTLIAPTPPDVAAFGVRGLSSFLKSRGKDVRLIFLPGGVEKYKHKSGFRYEYEKSILDTVVELCAGSGLVGLSFMSNYLDRGMQIANAVKKGCDAPLAVGGIHPTVMPEDCLKFSDIVCVGEGEEAVLDLVERIEAGRDYSDIQNLWVKRNGGLVRNPLRPLAQDLDIFPPYDFGTEDHYIYNNLTGKLAPMTKDILKRSFPMEPHIEGSFSDSYKRTLSYKTMTTRGCPHHCTFCAEKTLADLYTGQRYLRKRSIGHIMGELLWVKKELPFVESIFLFDDTFLARPTKEVVEFSQVYKQTIGMPFHIQVSPATVNEEKVEALLDAGLAFVEMGIQSTADSAKALYKRKTSDDVILKAAKIFHDHGRRISPPCYHVILDNPWETPHDNIQTLKTVLKLPSPFWLKRASLVCFPGTELYARAKRDGIIKTEEDEWREIFSKHLHTPKGSYVNMLMYLAGFSRFPRWIVGALAWEPLAGAMNKSWLSGFYTSLYRLTEGLIVVSKGIRAFARGDFSRIYKYVLRVTSRMS